MSTISTLRHWFQPIIDAFSTPSVPFTYRWRLLALQPIALLAYSVKALPWALVECFRSHLDPNTAVQSSSPCHCVQSSARTQCQSSAPSSSRYRWWWVPRWPSRERRRLLSTAVARNRSSRRVYTVSLLATQHLPGCSRGHRRSCQVVGAERGEALGSRCRTVDWHSRCRRWAMACSNGRVQPRSKDV
jgi:hypothetical protein